MFLKYLFDYFLDLLFPRNCIGCGEEGIYLCSKCGKEIILLKHSTCPECKKITKFGQYCSKHKKEYLNGIIVACYYHKGTLRELIHNFKYNGVKELTAILSEFMSQRLKEISPSGYKKWLVIPVPLHRKRLEERGYNQAELLAKKISESLGIKYHHGRDLIRKKYTIPQVKLPNNKRFENIKDSFEWKADKDKIKGSTVLLIDDVATTGSTLENCAEILKTKAGVRRVYGLVLAKG